MPNVLRISTEPPVVFNKTPINYGHGAGSYNLSSSRIAPISNPNSQPNFDAISSSSPSGSSEDELIKATNGPLRIAILPTGSIGTGRNGNVSQSPTGLDPAGEGSPERPKSFHGSQTSTTSRTSQASGNKKTKQEDPDHPTPQKLGKGYASMQTVLTVAALFCVGFLLTCSGVIILATQSHNETFRITGAVFLGVGLASVVLCAILQWKNVKKNVDRLEKQLFAI